MEACVMIAREYMKNSGLTDLKLAKKAIKAMVGFARARAEIGVEGKMFKPDLEFCLAIQTGLKKLDSETKGKSKPREFFQPSDDASLALWRDLPGKVQYRCSRCRHVVQPGERFRRSVERKGQGVTITTKLCPRCGCDGFYLFKYEVKK